MERNSGRMRLIAAVALMAALLVVAGGVWAGKEWNEIPDKDDLMLNEEFQLDPNARLRVDVSDIHIELVQVDSDVAKVEVYATGKNRDKAREYFEKLHLKVVNDENTIKVQTSRAMFRTSGFFHWSSHVRLRAIISIPRGTDMRVKTDDGNIISEVLSGKLDARTSDGDIILGEVDGPSVILKTSDGDIRVTSIEADEVDARSSDGDVTASRIVASSIVFSTSDGDVTITSVEADDIHMSSSDGSIQVDDLSGKKLRARTSDGDIRVTLRDEVALDLRTSDGDIEIIAPKGLKADLNLKGERIHISGGITLDGELSKRRAQGTVGGGGVEIVARTSDGDISFELER